jgi:arylsulfatase A-like enzyme
MRLLLCGLLASLSVMSASAKQPNILFIFSDDHALNAIGAYGSKFAKTPSLDRLAKEGMLFRHCLVTNSICGPSRATVLTGKYNHINGFPDNSSIFDNTQQTYPKLLQQAGYQTAVIGKWHLESDPTGFNHWCILPGQGSYYNPEFITAKGPEKVPGYVSEVITDKALKWLKEDRDQSKPFMLCYWHKAPHREWSPGPKQLGLYDGETIPEPATLFDDYKGRASPAGEHQMGIDQHMTLGYDNKLPPGPGAVEDAKLGRHAGWYGRMDDTQRKAWDAHYGPENEAFRKANPQGKDLVRWKYQRYMKDYLSCVAGVDAGVGEMLKYLDDSGLAKDTIVVYSSDQGFYLGEHGWFDKRWMYEETLHTPMIVRWPGVTAAGVENKDMVSTLDFAETFLDAAGVTVPADMQGRSLVPILKGQRPADWRTAHYYHYYEYPQPHHVAPHFGVRTENGYKLIHYYETKEWELFDLNKDPQELSSVHASNDYASIRESLETQLKGLQAQYQDTNPTAPPYKVTRRPNAAKGKAKGAKAKAKANP